MNATTGARDSQMRLLRLAALSLIAALFLSSCVTGSDGSDGDNGESEKEGEGGETSADQEENSDVIASSLTTSTVYHDDLKIDVNSLERIGGEKILLRMTLTNVGDSAVYTTDLMGEQQYRPDGVTLIDLDNQKRHWPLKDSDDECICTDWLADGMGTTLGKDGDTEFWVAFTAPPEDVSSMAVTTFITPDFLDIPISEGDGSNKDIAETETDDESQVFDLGTVQEGEESTREDSGDETSIMLSSDVLFDTDKSDLKAAAEETLEQVANEIDDSSGGSVSIDGHTDNTGDDSINEPLSEDRAEAVHKELQDLISRDVEFEVAGHGSSDPVATNETKDGRQKNRRVTVSFEK